MPNIKSAAKRAKTSLQNRIVNRAAKAHIGSLAKKFTEAVSTKDKAKSLEGFRTYASALDKAAKKGIITKNTAARKKSRSALKIAAIK